MNTSAGLLCTVSTLYILKSMKTKLQRWGNSLAIRIPNPVALDTHLQEGSEVEITANNGEIVVRPSLETYRLKDLLAKITDENIHAEGDFGEAQGKETW